jgi:hypothetical protein
VNCPKPVAPDDEIALGLNELSTAAIETARFGLTPISCAALITWPPCLSKFGLKAWSFTFLVYHHLQTFQAYLVISV